MRGAFRVLMVGMGLTTRKVDMGMTRRSDSSARIIARWGCITGGLILLFAPTAQATSDHPARTVRVITTPAPTRAMVTALRVCEPAHKAARPACHAVAVRPALDGLPSGVAVVRECFGQARLEAREWGAAHGRVYLRGCFEGNIRTP